MKPFLAVISFLFLFSGSLFATHNRAGEITYEHISGLTYRVRMVIYTKESSNIERNYLKIRWGDEPSGTPEESLDSLMRVNNGGLGLILPDYDDVKKNIYEGIHSYPGPGTYILQMEDPNRNEGVLNIATGPEGASVSVMTTFTLESVLIIRPGTLGSNNSVRLEGVPIQNACIYQPWIHNPIAVDPDGDDLRYSLVPCKGVGGVALSTWMSPADYTTDPSDTFEIDEITGDIHWNVPLEAGEYNIAIKIEEYRSGKLMGSVIRDMQITVKNCSNVPPAIADIEDKCVVANGSLEFTVSASDSGPNAGISALEAFGAPMTSVANVAQFSSVSILGPNVTGTFSWQPKCQEVRLEPYQVSFRVTDSGSPPGEFELSNFKSVRIRVVAPRVENPEAQAISNQINLSWNPTPCQHIFTGNDINKVKYLVYRRNNLFGFVPDECELGVPEYTGYTYIGETLGVNNTTFTDTDVAYGGVYCYMVVTVWPDGSESYASEEFCDTVKKDVPVMTKVSVGTTDFSVGQDTIHWSKPTALDTDIFPGPYTYRLYHGSGFGQPNELIYETNSFSELENGDSTFIHQNINTLDIANTYRVEIYSESLDAIVGTASRASSVFLNAQPGDNRVTLTMNHQVPWTNYRYDVYRKAPGESDYSYIGFSNTASYVDSGLVNNQSYCYFVEAIGSYYVDDVPPVLINRSQESCAMPYDNTPPCAPELSANTECEILFHELLWTNPEDSCGDDDVSAYNIYYSSSEGGEMELIATVDGAGNTTFIYDGGEEKSLAGCYAVAALDSLNLWPDGSFHQNESVLSNVICIDNCPIYELPNIFTPNGDGLNDLLRPIKYRYIKDVDFVLFNRWGKVVFETNDPELNWNGLNKDSSEISSDGVYYYVVKVNTIRLSGIETQTLKGFVRLADGTKPMSGN